MASTVIRGAQIKDSTVQRHDLDTITVGQAVVTKIVQGSGISLSSTGADSGTGDVTVSSPDVVSTDAGNIAVLGTDNHILVPQSQIWSVRLRSFNAIGNPSFEVSQRNVGGLLTNPANGTFIEDRWQHQKAGTHTENWQQTLGQVAIPGTSFVITTYFFRLTLTGQESSLAAGDYLNLLQFVEGPSLRELIGDVHSAQILVRSSVANLKFGVNLRDSAASRTLCKLCSLGSANTWILLTMPNMPVWSAGATFPVTPGSNGYVFGICLGAGSTYTASANDSWQTGNYLGALGQSNFMGQSVNSTFDIAFVQHEPGPLCTTLIDKPFTANLQESQRYFCKSYQYATRIPTATNQGALYFYGNPATFPRTPARFPVYMAKIPTVTVYSGNNAAPNTVYNDSTGANVSATSNDVADGGFLSLNIPTGVSAGQSGSFQWTADTGW